MTERADDPGAMPLPELDSACRRETQRHRRNEPSDPRFCLEIFRRALRREPQTNRYLDDPARDLVVRTYTDYVKANLNRRSTAYDALEEHVQQVWLRFWRAANSGLEFTTLDAALAYLKRTTVSTVIDAGRATYRRNREESLNALVDESGEAALASGEDSFDIHARERFRQRCRELLTDGQDYLIFWMRYGQGLPPRTIATELAGRGTLLRGAAPTARAISEALDRMIRQLATDDEIRALLAAD